VSAGADSPLARLVFALLVVACFGAFFLTQRLKHIPTAVQHFLFSSRFTPQGQHKLERISFRIRSADRVDVSVIDAAGHPVIALASDLALPAYQQRRFAWNGRTATGTPAPPGVYRVQVRLRAQRRTVLSPRSFRLIGPVATAGGGA